MGVINVQSPSLIGSSKCRGRPAVDATSLQTRGEASSSGQDDLPDKRKSDDLKSQAPVVPFDMDLYHWEEPSNTVEPRTLAP